MGTTAYGGKGSKGRASNGDRPVGATSCRQEQYTMASCQTPPPLQCPKAQCAHLGEELCHCFSRNEGLGSSEAVPVSICCALVPQYQYVGWPDRGLPKAKELKNILQVCPCVFSVVLTKGVTGHTPLPRRVLVDISPPFFCQQKR